MKTPVIAIIGRPNVGKSTLFNNFVGKKKAIVEDVPGVTRDRNYALIERFSIPFYLIDTGGYEIDATDTLQKFVVEQTLLAIDEADIVFCMFDGNTGVQPTDEEIVALLRKYKKQVYYIVNKCDGAEQNLKAVDFYSIGIGELHDISALYGRATKDLAEQALQALPNYSEIIAQTKEEKRRKEDENYKTELEIDNLLKQHPKEKDDEDLGNEFEEEVEEVQFEEDNFDFAPVFFEDESVGDEQIYLKQNRLQQVKRGGKILRNETPLDAEIDADEVEKLPELEKINVAIIGKPNVGKSTLFNSLLGYKQAITSDIAGTTRDSLDIEFERNGQKYVLVDTAGLRKKTKISDKVERYSTIRALNSLSDADVVVMVIDAVDGPQEQDTKILGLAHGHGVAVVLCINKWDLVEKDYKTVKEYTDKVREAFKFAKYAPIVFTSAISGRRCSKVLEAVRNVAIQRNRRIPTGELNRVLRFAHTRATAPAYRGRLLKFYFGTQITTCPPRFALFFNFTKGIHFSYLRSIKNTLRDKFGFEGTDIKLVLKKR